MKIDQFTQLCHNYFSSIVFTSIAPDECQVSLSQIDNARKVIVYKEWIKSDDSKKDLTIQPLISSKVDILLLPSINFNQSVNPELYQLNPLTIICPNPPQLSLFLNLLFQNEHLPIEELRAALLSSGLLEYWSITTGKIDPWSNIVFSPNFKEFHYIPPNRPPPNMKDSKERLRLLNRKKINK